MKFQIGDKVKTNSEWKNLMKGEYFTNRRRIDCAVIESYDLRYGENYNVRVIRGKGFNLKGVTCIGGCYLQKMK